jgi:hypothetical protein
MVNGMIPGREQCLINGEIYSKYGKDIACSLAVNFVDVYFDNPEESFYKMSLDDEDQIFEDEVLAIDKFIDQKHGSRYCLILVKKEEKSDLTVEKLLGLNDKYFEEGDGI